MNPSSETNSHPTSQEHHHHTPEKKRGEGWRGSLSSILILLAAPVVAIFLTAFVFQSYQVDGESMETTLQNHDRLIVWKMGRTWAKITGHAYVPKRGDVVVFTPKGLLGGENKQLIKRVIGLPGDRVVVKDGIVTVYNSQHPDGFVPDQTLPYGKVIPTTFDDQDVTVPGDSVFLMGDNRSNSLDSRAFGPVPLNDIAGKLVLRILPLGKAERF